MSLMQLQPNLNRPLFDYQEDTISWLLDRVNIDDSPSAYLLYLETGMGKTLIILCTMYLLTHSHSRGIYICNTSTISSIAYERDKFFNDRLGIVYDWKNYTHLASTVPTVLLVSYETVTSIHRHSKRPDSKYHLLASRFYDTCFDVVACDESHRLKNKRTKLYAAIRHLQKKVLVCATGTPVYNSLTDVRNQLLLGLNPDDHTRARDFYSRIFKREYADTSLELPELTQQRVECTLSPDEQARYNELYQTAMTVHVGYQNKRTSYMTLTQALNALRLCCAHSRDKATQALRLLDSLGAEKVVIFTNYPQIVQSLAKMINGSTEHATAIGITGNTPKPERYRYISEYTHTDRYRYLILTYKCGSYGLNLFVSHRVILYDPVWDYNLYHQAVSRVHRYGQRHAVVAYALIVPDTIEQIMLDSCTQKTNFKAILSSIDLDMGTILQIK